MNIRIASMKYTLNAPSARRVGVRTVTMIPINSKSQHKKQISNVANLLLFPISNDRRLVTPRLKLCSLVLEMWRKIFCLKEYLELLTYP